MEVCTGNYVKEITFGNDNCLTLEHINKNDDGIILKVSKRYSKVIMLTKALGLL